MKFETQTASVQVSGTLVFTDKDGKVVKETPFTGTLPQETEQKEEGDDDVRE
jgi:hypothetical protein